MDLMALRRSVMMSTTDSNLFDGQWELGRINTSTGAKTPSSTDIRCKNYVKGVPGKRLAFSRTDTTSFYMLAVAYKADKSFSRYLGAKSSMPTYYDLNSDEQYIMFYLYARTTPLENLRIEVAK